MAFWPMKLIFSFQQNMIFQIKAADHAIITGIVKKQAKQLEESMS
jgi:hypothetical protein